MFQFLAAEKMCRIHFRQSESILGNSSFSFFHPFSLMGLILPAKTFPPSLAPRARKEFHASHDLMICYVSSHLLSSHSPSLTIITTDHQYAEMISFSSREIFVRSIISAGYSQWMRECGQGAQRTWSTFRSLTHTRDATLKIVM